MVSVDFGARPSSKFEMAGEEHLMLDELVQVKGSVMHALLAFVSTNLHPCLLTDTVTAG
jgi:hypothetical protein